MLEIECGMGSHSALFESQGMNLTAIDLTQHAVDMANERFKVFGINNAFAEVVDAENMPLPDNFF